MQPRVRRLAFSAHVNKQKALAHVSRQLIDKKPTLLLFGSAVCRGRFGGRNAPTKLVRRHLEVEAARYGGQLVLVGENR